jgi:lysophospholipase L1-like esterase
VAVLAVGAGSAAAQDGSVGLRASRGRIGYVALTVSAPAGATATVDELRGSRAIPLRSATVPAGGELEIEQAAPWRCSPRRRVFAVTVTAADGSTGTATTHIRTPSCARRFALGAVPAEPRLGRRVSVRLRDHWRLGALGTRVCATGPGATACRRLALPAGRAEATWRWTPPRPGRWTLAARPRGQRVTRGVRVRPRDGSLQLVAAGDSMIQIIDDYLRDRLAPDHVSVRFDDHISTGITKPFMLDWVRHARRDARVHRPDVTVMFLGANDGYALPTPGGRRQCCGHAWIRAYAKRADAMMRAYARGGRGRVYWMLLPQPRERVFQEVFAGVNAALRIAAARHPDSVRLVDLGATFTPHGRFQQSIRRHGRLVSVRQRDGVHLNTAGASIAATVIIRALRRDGVL